MSEKLFNIEEECDVLGAMLESTNARNDILNILVEDDFYEKNGPHQLIFRAIEKLASESAVVDITSVTTELGVNMKCLDYVGGTQYLINLQERYIGDRNAVYHANTVKDLSLARRLHACLKNCYEGFENEKFEDIGQYVAECETKILDITKARRVSEFESAGDIVERITDEMKLSKGKKQKNQNVSTGFSLLNYYTKGWQPGQFNIIGARPSVGKTAFALNLAYNAAQTSGKTVAFFSLEMDAKSIVKRMLSTVSSLSGDSIYEGNLSDSDWLNLDSAVKAIKNCKLWIDDTPGEKLTDIKTKVFKLKAQNPDLCAIFIDYLGLITTNLKVDNRQNEVAAISRQLKALAREVEVPIICLSQLSRDNEKRNKTDQAPKLSDLRDSGSIEQDADIVLFIHRESYQKSGGEGEFNNTNEIEENKVDRTIVTVAKNRNGKTGPIAFEMIMNTGKFVELIPEGKE